MSNQIDYRLASKNKVRHSSENYELKVAYYSFIRVQEVYTINVQI